MVQALSAVRNAASFTGRALRDWSETGGPCSGNFTIVLLQVIFGSPCLGWCVRQKLLAPATVGGAQTRGGGQQPSTIALAKERKREIDITHMHHVSCAARGALCLCIKPFAFHVICVMQLCNTHCAQVYIYIYTYTHIYIHTENIMYVCMYVYILMLWTCLHSHTC